MAMTTINRFIYQKVNSSPKENKIPFRFIPNSICEIWVQIWNKMTPEEQSIYKLKTKKK